MGGKRVGIEMRYQDNEATASQGRERSVPPSIEVSGKYRWENVKTKNDSMHADHVIQQHSDEEQGKKQPQLPIDFF
jgi:hypothetical protein